HNSASRRFRHCASSPARPVSGVLPMVKVLRLALAACLLCLAGCATGGVDTTRTFHTVVIDPGHGGKDSGVARNHLQEKNLALDVALRLRPKLEAAGFNTV